MFHSNLRLPQVNNMLATYVFRTRTHFILRSTPQVANLGGHPVPPPFKIPESIIY